MKLKNIGNNSGKLKLKILRVDQNTYYMRNMDPQDDHSKSSPIKDYKMNIEFLDIPNPPKEQDILYIAPELFDHRYCEYMPFNYFGALDNPSGRKASSYHEIDVIRIEYRERRRISGRGKTVFLKRLYG